MGALSGGRLRRLVPIAIVLLLLSALAGAVATAGAALASRGLLVRSRAPLWARVYAVTLTRHAEGALRAAAAIEGVHSAQLRRLSEIRPDRGGGDAESGERLRVIDLEIAPDGGLGGSLAALKGIAGVVEIVDTNATERASYTDRRGFVLLVAGIALVALGAAGYVVGVAGTVAIAARECRDEIAVRHLLGSDPVRLWGPFALAFGGTAALGVLATVAGVVSAIVFLRDQGSAPFAPALGLVAAGGASWLVGTAALAVAVTRQTVLRVARAAIAIAAMLAVLQPGSARADATEDLESATRELRQVARELADARHARHRAELRLAESDRAVATGRIASDPVAEALARARRHIDASELERWSRRCRRLSERRDTLRARRHLARVGPPIEPRVIPVGGAVAVPFETPEERIRSAAFRHGIGLRLGGGETIVATAPGRVVYAGNLAGVGPVVVVDHGRRVYSVYGRIGLALVRTGAKVGSGEPVARAPERPGLLYFSVRDRGRAIDPLLWIEASDGSRGVAGRPLDALERRTDGSDSSLGRG
jgi:septal ring factor EnvC (AmiA/AmiB activator)